MGEKNNIFVAFCENEGYKKGRIGTRYAIQNTVLFDSLTSHACSALSIHTVELCQSAVSPSQERLEKMRKKPMSGLLTLCKLVDSEENFNLQSKNSYNLLANFPIRRSKPFFEI
jgi:hypothetical protein